jgi:hypothetical protein
MPSVIAEDLTQPGTHALVIGVSEYRHFEDGAEPTPQGEEFHMEQLSAAARSASEFARWLLQDYRCQRAPLRSLRVLLSPSPGEQIEPGVADLLAATDHAATRANVQEAVVEFRDACDSHTENVLVVYVAGHGVQLTKHGAIVLLNDFGRPGQIARLEGAIDMAAVHAGMNHPNTARTQFWFVDACRQKPSIARRFESLEGALALDEPNGSTEVSPLFLAATTGTQAFARPGGVTLFNEALMASLGGAAATGPKGGDIDCWHVSVTELIRQLPDEVMALAEAEGAEQSVDVAGKIHEAVVHEFEVTPQVDLRVELLPEHARPVSRGSLKQNAKTVIVENFTDWPLQRQVDAGLYLLNIEADAPFENWDEILNLDPPEMTAEVDVAP